MNPPLFAPTSPLLCPWVALYQVMKGFLLCFCSLFSRNNGDNGVFRQGNKFPEASGQGMKILENKVEQTRIQRFLLIFFPP